LKFNVVTDTPVSLALHIILSLFIHTILYVWFGGGFAKTTYYGELYIHCYNEMTMPCDMHVVTLQLSWRDYVMCCHQGRSSDYNPYLLHLIGEVISRLRGDQTKNCYDGMCFFLSPSGTANSLARTRRDRAPPEIYF